MWTYTRKHSIHKHPRTIHFDSFTIDIDEEGKVLSPITPEMEAVFKKHRAFIFEEPHVPTLAQYFANIDAEMGESLDEEEATVFVQLAQSSTPVAQEVLTASDSAESEESEESEDEGEQQAAPARARGRRKKQ